MSDIEMHETPGFPGFDHIAGTEPSTCFACEPPKHTGPHKTLTGEYVRCSGCEPELGGLDLTGLAEAWANVMDGRRVEGGRIGRDTTTAADWQAIAREYLFLDPDREHDHSLKHDDWWYEDGCRTT